MVTRNTKQRHSRSGRSGAQTVERALFVLKEIAAAHGTGLSVAELVDKVRLNRTTVHRLLKCLSTQGAVRRNEHRKTYSLGPLAYELGLAAREQLDLKALFAPALSRIAETAGDTSFLMLRSGNDAVCIDRRLGSYPVKTLVVEVGTRRPLGIGAGSLAMLSALPDSQIERIVRAQASRLPAYGTTADALMRTVRLTQKAGYASGYVHGVDGVIAVGLPIIDSSGEPIAALSVAAIEKRMAKPRQAELAELLREETSRLREILANALIVDA